MDFVEVVTVEMGEIGLEMRDGAWCCAVGTRARCI